MLYFHVRWWKKAHLGETLPPLSCYRGATCTKNKIKSLPSADVQSRYKAYTMAAHKHTSKVGKHSRLDEHTVTFLNHKRWTKPPSKSMLAISRDTKPSHMRRHKKSKICQHSTMYQRQTNLWFSSCKACTQYSIQCLEEKTAVRSAQSGTV